MNRIYRTVWNRRRNAYMVVGENTSSQGKSSSSTGALLASVLLGVAIGSPAQAAGLAPTVLPSGAVVTAGQALIGQNGNSMTILQGSAKAAIEWNHFSIGKDASVHFVQPNAAAIALNRVTGKEGSVINGLLNANGQVFILNPNGVLFGKGARVDTAGLLATTLNISDADFMAGKTSFSGHAGVVSNLGSLQAHEGGYIALLGGQVSNHGTITATRGTVALAAGNKISLKFSQDALVGVVLDEAALAALVANGQAIHADGGSVIMSAKGAEGLLNTVVNNTGEIRARTIEHKEGKIYLLGEGGAVEVAGKLDVSAPTGGNGGFVETSSHTVKIADGTQVNSLANMGNNGTWLIDPLDFNISSGTATQTTSGIGATTLQTALGNGNVVIQTQSAGAELGNINVNAPVAWSANKLTLEAHADININAIMSATGTSTLDLKTGYNFNQGSPQFVKTNHVLVGIQNENSFKGRIDFDRSGTDILAINGKNITLINALGDQGSKTKLDLQGINGNSNGYYALASNIDASSTSTWNSGKGFTPITFANGAVFDGLGHSVHGLSVNQTKGSYVGLFGQTSGTLRNVAVTGATIVANQGAGVLAGLSMGPTINAITSGTVSGPGGYVGGAIGAIYDGQNTNIHASGTVSSIGNNVGGLAGYLAYQIKISNTSASTNVTGGGTWTGGLIGQNDYGYIDTSHSTGTVSGKDQTGGLVGSNNSGKVTNSYSTSDVTGIGTNATGGTGGLVGKNSNGQVTGSYATGVINGVDNVGGLIGNTEQKGGVTAANTISTSYSTGSVISIGKNVGGLIGYNNANAVTNVYSRGSIEATGDNVGGLIGKNGGAVTNAYATGYTSSGGSEIGGLIGLNTGTVTNSFWDKQTTGQSTSAGGGTAKTSAEMKVSSLFTDATWNFTFHSGVWARKDTLNDAYPILRTFGYTDPITITLNDLALSRGYGDANPTLGATGWTVSGCDDNATCLGSVDWGSAITATSKVGIYNYGDANTLLVTLGKGYGTLNDYEISITKGTLSVTKAQLTVDGSTANDKPYDRTDTATINLGVLTGLKNGETLNLSAGSAVFDSANAGSRTASATLTLKDGTGSVSNYEMASNKLSGIAATISPLAINVAGQNDKPYDRLSSVDANLLKITNVIGGDKVSLSGSATLAGKDVGLQALSSLSGLKIDNANYTLTDATMGSGVTIFPRLVSVQNKTGASRVYDGSTDAVYSLLELTNVINGDTVNLSGGKAVLGGKDAGKQTVTGVGTLALDNKNYTLEEATAAGTVLITPLAINVAGQNDKPYDRLTSVDANLLKITNVIGGDKVSLSGSATLAGKDVGLQALSSLSGLTINNANYTVTDATMGSGVTIFPRLVSVQNKTGASRVYDGSTDAVYSLLELTNVINGDTVNLSGGKAVLGGKDAGKQTVTGVGTLALDNKNYTLEEATASGSVTITPLALVIAAAEDATRVYNGTKLVATTLLKMNNVLGGDKISLSGTATLLDKNVGNQSVVSPSGLSIDNANYTLTNATMQGSVSITAKAASAQAIADAARLYNGSATADSNLFSITGLLEGDSAVLGGSATLASKNVGNQAVTGFAGLTISNSNYRLTAAHGNLAISALPVSIATISNASREYNGTDTAAASLLQITNAASGDNVTLAGSATLAGKNVGSQALSNLAGLTLSDTNYTFIGASMSGNLQITQRALGVATVEGASRIYDGSNLVNANLLALSGLLDGDSASLSGSGGLAAKDVGLRALTSLDGLKLSNSNYTLNGATASGNLSITPRMVNLSAIAGATRLYDASATVAADLLSVNGLVSGDRASLTGNATLTAKDVGNQAISSLAGLSLSNGNYSLNGASASGVVAITPRPLALLPIDSASRLYNGGTELAANLLKVNGLLEGDSTNLSGSLSLAAKNVGNQALIGLGSFKQSNPNYLVTTASLSGSVTINALPIKASTVTGASKPFDGSTEAAASLFSLDGILSGDSAVLGGNATLASNAGNVSVVGLGSLNLNNSNYKLSGASGTVNIVSAVQSTQTDTTAEAQRVEVPGKTEMLGNAGLPNKDTISQFTPLPPNVKTTPANLSASFGEGVALNLVSSPGPNEKTESVTLEQAKRMVAPNAGQGTGEREVRVPVSRNSLAEIVNGGVKLPGGVDQLLFVVKGN